MTSQDLGLLFKSVREGMRWSHRDVATLFAMGTNGVSKLKKLESKGHGMVRAAEVLSQLELLGVTIKVRGRGAKAELLLEVPDDKVRR